MLSAKIYVSAHIRDNIPAFLRLASTFTLLITMSSEPCDIWRSSWTQQSVLFWLSVFQPASLLPCGLLASCQSVLTKSGQDLSLTARAAASNANNTHLCLFLMLRTG